MAEDNTIVIYDQEPTVVEVNEAGGKVDSVNGKQGTVVLHAEDINFLVGNADQALGGHRVVKATATGFDYADSTVLSDAQAVVGITGGAASASSEVTVITSGKVTEPSWSWTVGQNVYLSTNGLMTQTAPSSGFLIVIGKALSATTLLISINTPITLA